MLDKKLLEELDGARSKYEAPSVALIYWSEDILAATTSTEVGEEYPDEWN